jgi:hypothetical protein
MKTVKEADQAATNSNAVSDLLQQNPRSLPPPTLTDPLRHSDALTLCNQVDSTLLYPTHLRLLPNVTMKLRFDKVSERELATCSSSSSRCVMPLRLSWLASSSMVSEALGTNPNLLVKRGS